MSRQALIVKTLDNTNTLIFVDKIQYIAERNGYVAIRLINDVTITFEMTLQELLKELLISNDIDKKRLATVISESHLCVNSKKLAGYLIENGVKIPSTEVERILTQVWI